MKNYLLISMLLMAGCAGSGKNVSMAAAPEKTPENTVQAAPAQTKTETDEAKAVRLAEEFIKLNGYTDAPADKEHLTSEPIEWESDLDKMLVMRKNSLEAKAFGVSQGGKGTDRGWTVVFRPQFSRVDKKRNLKTGRAVTMDENFQSLKVQHEGYILARVQKKL
jgi:hypothetical protein